MQDFIYLDGKSGWVRSGRSQNNTIYLSLIQGATAAKITYLPAFFSDANSAFYDGPQIKNWKGMRAFAFYGFPIDAQVPTTPPTTPPPLPEPPTTVVKPVVPVAPTLPAPTPPKADLSLLMDVNDRFPTVGDTLTYAVVVKNDGSDNASNIEIKSVLPAGVLLFVNSSDFVNQGGTLRATVANLAKGDMKILKYRVKILQTGKIWNKAEVSKSDLPDPDSSPDNGTENGEDDCTKVDITSRELTLPPPPPVEPLTPTVPPPAPPTTVPIDTTTPTPPKVIPPAVPEPPKEVADLSLSMSADRTQVSVGQIVTIVIVLRNDGPNAAQNVGFRNTLPPGLAFVSSSLLSYQNGVLSATLSGLPSGAEFMVSFMAKATEAGALINRAEITKSNQTDPDSKPDNGPDNGEDDTKSLVVNVLPLNCKPVCLPFEVKRIR